MKHKWPYILTGALILLFVGSMLWINFHSALWYDMDMALNSLEAKVFWESKTLFPEGWLFGNQYQIVDSVNVAALFYGLCHRSTLSMSLAASTGMFLILGSFIACFKHQMSREGLVTGLLCLSGGTIFGYSAASYTKGLQVLYTMGAYYAWYLIIMLLTLGAWLRIRDGKKVHWLIWTGLLALNFGIGMNSLREALVLGCPLVALSFAEALKDKKSGRYLLFSGLVLASEAAGYLLMQALKVPSSTNINQLYLSFYPVYVFYNGLHSTKNLLRLSGIGLFRDGLCYLPLSLCALVVAAGVVFTLVHIIRKRDETPLARAILFCAASVLTVYATGVFVFKTRDIYYFVYWLLAALSMGYLVQHFGKRIIVPTVAVAAIGWAYQFPRDFMYWNRHGEEMKAITETLVRKGVTTLYHDDCAMFAAASGDAITAAPVRIVPSEDGDLCIRVFPYNKYLPLYGNDPYQNSAFCFSNYSGLSVEELDEGLAGKAEQNGHFHWKDKEIMLFSPLTEAPPWQE